MSDSTIINYSDYVTGNYTLPEVGNGKSLQSKDFYTLLLAEIAHQDPTEPMDNKDMILQLSQFSAIENTQKLNTNMDSYIAKASMSTAASLLGKNVEYLDSDSGNYYSGTVTGVTKDSDGYYLQVGNNKVSMDKVVEITDATAQKTTTATE